MYVILQDRDQDLGEGYSSSSWNEFIGAVKDFETARNVIEHLADYEIGEEIDYNYCDNKCKKGFCGDCIYKNHGVVEDEDWNKITVSCDDIYRTWLTYHFIKVEL